MLRLPVARSSVAQLALAGFAKGSALLLACVAISSLTTASPLGFIGRSFSTLWYIWLVMFFIFVSECTYLTALLSPHDRDLSMNNTYGHRQRMNKWVLVFTALFTVIMTILAIVLIELADVDRRPIFMVLLAIVSVARLISFVAHMWSLYTAQPDVDYELVKAAAEPWTP